MIKPTRLFDVLDYQLNRYPKEDMLTAKINGEWKPYSTSCVKKIVNRLSAGLTELGVSANDHTDEGRDKIGIISNNRPEWIFTDLAVQQTGAVLVPVYPTTNSLELEYIFNHVGIKYIFAGNKALYEKIKEVSSKIPTLKGIYTFDEIEDAAHWTNVCDMATAQSLEKLEEIKMQVTEDAVTTIIYTSGTTGTPKGVMLTHKNMLSNLFAIKTSFPIDCTPEYRLLSFLPLNHILEKIVAYTLLFSCASIYFAESIDTIGENMREVKPHVFATVPRLLEKVFERIVNAGNNLRGIKRLIFLLSVQLANKYDNTKSRGAWYNFRMKLADKLVFSKWRQALGGNVEVVVTGGAACQVKLLRIFNAAKIPVYEGYGPTENSPVITLNRRDIPQRNRYGTVGQVLNGLEVKLEEDGEICVKGPTIMKGYYKKPELTEEVIIDGWLHTGDIGTWIDNEYLKITDRKKELFKTSGGKYVAPQPIENKLKESVYVEHALVVGPERKYVGALIIPHFGSLQRWMQLHEVPFTTNEAALNNEKVRELYTKLIARCNENFNPVEQIKKFELLSAEWGIETGELTPKLSIRRKIIMEKYHDIIEKIYKE